MKICVIGNGSSNKFYSKNTEEYDLIICCNIPQHGYKWDIISIIDPQPVRIIKEKKLNMGRIWCPPDTHRSAKIKNLAGEWCPIYKRKPWYNSGLLSIDYVCENYDDVKEIHVWGFNSLHDDDFHSQMDNLVPRKRTRNLNKYWVPKWDEVLTKYPKVKFVIHIPEGKNLNPTLTEKHKNYTAFHHSD